MLLTIDTAQVSTGVLRINMFPFFKIIVIRTDVLSFLNISLCTDRCSKNVKVRTNQSKCFLTIEGIFLIFYSSNF